MATVIFILLVVIAGMAIGWRADRRATKKAEAISIESHRLAIGALAGESRRTVELEAEIQRLRKIPLTQPQEKRDDSTIKAKSSADVRRLTEAAFGLQPEIGASNEDE